MAIETPRVRAQFGHRRKELATHPDPAPSRLPRAIDQSGGVVRDGSSICAWREASSADHVIAQGIRATHAYAVGVLDSSRMQREFGLTATPLVDIICDGLVESQSRASLRM